MTDDAPLVVFFPEQAYGPTNNCVGIGQELLRRGLRVCFIVEESFAGTLAAQGFEERVMRLTPPPTTEEAPGQFWTDFIRETAPVFRASTREQLEGFVAPTWQALTADGQHHRAALQRQAGGQRHGVSRLAEKRGPDTLPLRRHLVGQQRHRPLVLQRTAHQADATH